MNKLEVLKELEAIKTSLDSCKIVLSSLDVDSKYVEDSIIKSENDLDVLIRSISD